MSQSSTRNVSDTTPFTLQGSGIRRRLSADRLVRYLVSVGGVSVILSILGILLVIVWVAYPLFKGPSYYPLGQLALDGEKGFAAGTDEYREIAYRVHSAGLDFYSLKENKRISSASLPDLQGASIAAAFRGQRDYFALALSDGRILPVQVAFDVQYAEGKRSVHPELTAENPLEPFEGQGIPKMLAVHATENTKRFAAITGAGLAVHTVAVKKSLLGGVTRKEERETFPLPIDGQVSVLVFHPEGEWVYGGTTTGQIFRIGVGGSEEEPASPEILGWLPQENRGVSMLGFVLGGKTLAVGDAAGDIFTYQLLKKNEKDQLVLIHRYDPFGSAVKFFYPSPRNKGFLAGDEKGTVRFHYATTGQTQFELQKASAGELRDILISTKADGILLLTSAALNHWEFSHPHPEISWNSLFGKVHYEGYPEPAYVWQSTGGTDEFEPKLSLTPLLMGTLKGTLYAMLFAVPLALLSAFYASQFMHPAFKNVVKPVIEIMAALPSVVLGFFAALWLAPNIERVLPGLMLVPFTTVFLVTGYVLGKEKFPKYFWTGTKPGAEIGVLVVLVLAGGMAGLLLGPAFESGLLLGDYRAWLKGAAGLHYDQRNCIVVGAAMGFAVVPIIFTIAEDSLSSVPNHLKAGSLALGATLWQTAVKIILPTASPGIFSAIMIGFGRAIGETMIVLMATGNTPIMEWNIFNGFRAMSANIAVELPEAPEGGTLFRVLFLAAFMLFMLTFIVNSLAEWVRLRLRERYRLL